MNASTRHTRIHKISTCLGMTVGFWLLGVQISNGAVVTWDGDTSANWSDAGNWDVAPINLDSLTFSGTSNQTNTNNSALSTIQTLTLSNAGWNIDLGTLTLGWTTGIAINATGPSSLSGNLTLLNGDRTITLNGTNSTLTLNGTLRLRRSSNSKLTVNGLGNTLQVQDLQLTDGATRTRTFEGTSNIIVNGTVTNQGATSSPFGNAGSLVKAGTNTLTLNGANYYTGTTSVNAGSLIINGNSSAATGAVTVNTNGTFGGSGTIGGATTINGTLRPGQSVGTMTFNSSLSFTSTAITYMEIDGNAGAGVMGGHDFINLTGAGAAGLLTYDGTLILEIGTLLSAGSYSWDLFDFVSETGTLTAITLADQYSGSLLDGDMDGIWVLNSGSESWTFTEANGTLQLTVIPEPKAAVLAALGLLLLVRRKR